MAVKKFNTAADHLLYQIIYSLLDCPFGHVEVFQTSSFSFASLSSLVGWYTVVGGGSKLSRRELFDLLFTLLC